MTTLDLKAFRSAVAHQDPHRIAVGVRAAQADGLTEDQIFRIALATDSEMTRDAWADLVQESLTKHPAEFKRGARIETHPCTDEWMQGDRFGNVRSTDKHGLVRVKLDSGRVRAFEPRHIKLAVF